MACGDKCSGHEVYMDTVNSSNKTWHVVISVVDNNMKQVEKVFQNARDPEAHTWQSPPPLNYNV